MSWSSYHMIDPTDIEARFSVEDGMSYMDSIFTEPSEESKEKIEYVKVIMESLPPREADFVDLYYFKRLKQTDIATLFGVSQPTVCYRLQRAANRIKFLLHLPPVDESVLAADLAAFLSDPLDAQIMMLMWKTTCQSVVAKQLNVSQGLVRHRFLRAVKRMRGKVEMGEDAEDRFDLYVRLFEFIAANLNILREVQRPAWDNRIVNCLD